MDIDPLDEKLSSLFQTPKSSEWLGCVEEAAILESISLEVALIPVKLAISVDQDDLTFEEQLKALKDEKFTRVDHRHKVYQSVLTPDHQQDQTSEAFVEQFTVALTKPTLTSSTMKEEQPLHHHSIESSILIINSVQQEQKSFEQAVTNRLDCIESRLDQMSLQINRIIDLLTTNR